MTKTIDQLLDEYRVNQHDPLKALDILIELFALTQPKTQSQLGTPHTQLTKLRMEGNR